MLTRLKSKVAAQKATNIKTIVGTQTDPRLPRGTLDYVLMVDVYHELSQPQIILRNIAAALKPGGKLVLIEFRKEDSRPNRNRHSELAAISRSELSRFFDRHRLGIDNRDHLGTMIFFTSE
jgi:SAM-dependent methyltransferase